MSENYGNSTESSVLLEALESLQITRIEGVHKTYLVVKELQKDCPDYQMQMLWHNQLPGMLKMEIRCIDNEYFYYYEITEFITLQEHFALHRLEYRQAMSILNGIVSAIFTGREYLLNKERYILDAEYIFWDSKKEKVMLCYQTGYKGEMHKQLSALLEYMMDVLNHKEKKVVRLVYGLYKELKGKEDVLVIVEEYLERFEIEEMQIEELSRREAVVKKGIALGEKTGLEVIDVDKHVENNIEENTKKSIKKNVEKNTEQENAMQEEQELASMLQKKYEKQQLALLFLIGSIIIFSSIILYLS